MFTGIIETLGRVAAIEPKDQNLDFTIESTISDELKIDQSVSHNGVCLTVVAIGPGWHKVSAIKETLDVSNLKSLKKGDQVNLERAMILGSRLDGHLVQGHVDGTAKCISIADQQGSKLCTFSFDPADRNLLIHKGSVAIDGISLTLISPTDTEFKVAIIPYTWEHTNFEQLKKGSIVNLEYDIIGKYLARRL